MSRSTPETIASVMGLGGRPANSRREIRIIDTTLRDAHQSLWATRMRTEHIVSLAADFDRVGFEQVDLMAPIQFDVAVRYLKEDPWERVRLAHRHAPSTTFRALIRSKNIASFDFLADDVIIAWVERLYANGFRVIGSFDGLNDVDNIAPGLVRAKELGASTFGAVSFCESPVHTDELFVAKARELIEKADVDAIMLKDAGGLLTPDRVRTLVPALKAVMGGRPLEVHSHCLTGLAPLVYLEAVEAGADALHLSIAPLANGNAQPATQGVVRDLRALGYTVNVDDERIETISEKLTAIAEAEGKPLGVPVAYNGLHYLHQTPGGMLSNFQSQLATAGLSERFDELLLEVARVRAELAFPIMITPFAQFVGTQAVMNVMSGERYKVVPNEIKKYVLGYYGTLLAPIDPELRAKIIANGASNIALEPGPIAPMLPELRRRHPDEDIDLLLLRAMFAGTQVDEMKRTVAAGGNPDEVYGPLLDLVKALYAKSATGTQSLKVGDLQINLEKGESDNAA
ncbi:pyruvate carboxylase subunit B [Herbiconiux ginsengi]|uniref:Pyruvate carboxylase subunit B n=1 Tax=Herbiconiux ginsengi TaxID=381665 RepID=A0A1H3NE51_9MICO|nr:pyruvate carboxylase subunit B [Herbiconiux ginsengi]SDY87211.1 pyruvate carboxylase subunit B [Herbiconiux ginsengi]